MGEAERTFERLVETIKKIVQRGEGNEIPAHALLICDNFPDGVVDLTFASPIEKYIKFHEVLPKIVALHQPKICAIILPSTMKSLDPETNEIVEEKDVILVVKLTPRSEKVYIIGLDENGEIFVNVNDHFESPLIERVRWAMRDSTISYF